MSKTYRIANPERIQRVMHLRSSNAAVPIPSRKAATRRANTKSAVRTALRKEFA